jgi:hypothetical protein
MLKAAPLARLAAAFLSLSMLAGGAHSAGGTQVLPSAAEIIDRNATARGGIAAWRNVKTMTQFGHLEGGSPGSGATKSAHASSNAGALPHTRSVGYTMYLARPHKMRLEVQVEGATAIQMFDGSRGWRIAPSPQGPVVAEYSAEEARVAASQQDLDGPLIDSKANGTKVEVEALEAINGTDNYRLKLTTKDGSVRHLWVDARTYLDTKIDGVRVVGGRAWPSATYFTAYQKVGNLLVPHLIETAVNDTRSTERIVIDRVVLNAPMKDSYFAPPTRSDTSATDPKK